ncbi:MAG: hypothetical protein NZO16_04500, partial [Deltaproteobacteria bacterium]|nr:hypothetical protein [Deltaproteobacteria bacterium]
LKQKLFSEYGLIISRLAIRKIDSGMKIYIRNRSVFQLDEQPEHDILQLICQKINPFLHELVDEKTVIYLNSIYENNRGQINHENSISFFKAKEIIIALLKEGVRLKPLDIALETLFNLPPGIQIEEGVYEMRKRILPRYLGNLDGTDMYMLDQDDAVIIEETLMQGNVLPFSVVKHLKENLPDSENTVLVVFRCTSSYLKKTLGFTRTKIISTEELPENFQGTKLSTIKIGLKDEIDFASAY